MSDTPEGPDWWRATDGRWYPPELFTGPPELRPGAERRQADAEPRGEPDAGAPNRSMAMVAVAVAVLLLVAAGAWWVMSREDGGGEPDETAAGASTSTGPVRVAGTLRVDSSVPLTAIAPTDCDGWSQLLRVQVLGPSGDQLSEFAPEPTESSAGRESTRTDALKELDCELRYEADVPAQPGYTVVVRNVRDGGRPSVSQQLDGTERGDLDAAAIELTFSCDAANVCVLRPAP